MSGEPIVRRADDGVLSVEWPKGRQDRFECASDVLDEIVVMQNAFRLACIRHVGLGQWETMTDECMAAAREGVKP